MHKLCRGVLFSIKSDDNGRKDPPKLFIFFNAVDLALGCQIESSESEPEIPEIVFNFIYKDSCIF